MISTQKFLHTILPKKIIVEGDFNLSFFVIKLKKASFLIIGHIFGAFLPCNTQNKNFSDVNL